MTLLRFAGFTLDTVNRELRRGGSPVPAEPKVLECIELLVRRAGELVTTDELRRALWPDVTVGTDAMRQVIYGARKALGDRGSSPSLIKNRKRLGYVFAGEVSQAEAPRAWPFVGRVHELGALRDVITTLKLGRGAACLVSGEAGAGKSALVNRLREAVPAAEIACATGRCHATSGVPAFWPLREMAREDGDFPDVTSLGGGTAADAEQRFLACDAFVARLREMSHRRPRLLIFEDLHWADDGTLLVFEWLARGAHDGPLAVVGTYRPDAAAPGTPLAKVLGRLSGREGSLDVSLSALSTDDLLTLLHELSHPSATRRGAESLRDMTGGNALFVRQVVQSTASGHAAPAEFLRGGLRHVVLERTDGLPEATRGILAAAAVLGDDFTFGLLETLTGASSTDVQSALQPAIGAGIVGRSANGVYRFAHSLIRDVVYGALPVPEREAQHARALSAWSATPPGATRTAAIATHAFFAGAAVPHGRRLESCEAAGREAFAALAFDQAAIHLERALALGHGAPSAAMAELALLAARARWEADALFEVAEKAFLGAADIARSAYAPLIFAQAAIGAAVGEDSVSSLANARWKPENAALLEEALTLLGTAPPSPLCITLENRVARALAAVRGATGDHAGAQAAATLALSREPPEGEPWTHIQNAFIAFTRAVWLDGSESGESLVPEVIRLSSHPNLREWQRIEACAIRKSAALLRGDAAAYRDAHDEVSRRVARLPEPPLFGRSGDRLAIYRAIRDLGAVTMAIFEGRFEEAERLLQASHPRASPPPREMDEMAFALRLQLRTYQGRAAILQDELEARSRKHPEDAWHLSIARAQIRLARGDVAGARQSYEVLRRTEFRVPHDGQFARAKPEARWRMVELCLALGNDADAALLFESRGGGAHYFITDGVVLAFGSSSRPMGELAEKLGRIDDAERLFRQAVAMNARMGHRPESIHSRMCLARLLWDRQPRESKAALAAARTEALALGMTPLVTLADRIGSVRA